MTEVTVCPVCLNNINGNYGFCNVNCDHIYCMECMLKTTCPVCSSEKVPINIKEEVEDAYKQGLKDGAEESRAELTELHEKYTFILTLLKNRS